MGDEKSANTASSYGVDSNWYADSGATDHVMGELDKLAVKDTYNRGDQIYTTSGSGMYINHIGHAIIRTPHRDLKLNHILHVLQSSKSLASIHKVTSDNNIFFELHTDFFFIKDRESRKTLLKGRSKGGLYHLPCSTLASSHEKRLLNVNKPHQSRWHARLGHPSSSIVRFVVSNNNLPCVSDPSLDLVCDACQLGKSHQLPYPKSTSVSTSPLELIFSDVWVLPVTLLEEINIMLVSLMISTSSHGFSYSSTSLKFFKSFKN
jgi:hypothetical protein